MAARRSSTEERSPEQIRVGIERTRSQLDDTVGAIGDKLSPGRFVDELWMRVQSEGASAVAHTLREHPIPFTLVGAGLGWLVYERANGRHDRGTGHARREPQRRVDGYDVEYDDDAESGVRAGAAGAMRHAKESLQETTARVKQSAAEARHGVQEKASTAADAVSEKLSDAKESVTETAESAARGVKDRAERAREGFWHMLERNPVAVGAIALGAGLAAGLSAPRTRWEDDRMGRVAGSFKRETRQVVEETAGKVMGVAEEAYDTAREGAKATVDAARERGRQEGLTFEGVERMASRPADAARRAADE